MRRFIRAGGNTETSQSTASRLTELRAQQFYFLTFISTFTAGCGPWVLSPLGGSGGFTVSSLLLIFPFN